jgi:hypothetical protein
LTHGGHAKKRDDLIVFSEKETLPVQPTIGIVAIASLMIVAGLAWLIVACAAAPRPPEQPKEFPGANGLCQTSVSSIDNPRRADDALALPVWIFEPTGTEIATIGGGRCDDAVRPTIFIGHGFGQKDPAAYAELIEHFVSVGNVVIYPTYDVTDGEQGALEESYRVADAGIVAAVAASPRVDTSRVGWWGHSHGGGMVPWLVQQGIARGWGGQAVWMSIIAQAFTQLVGVSEITVGPHTQALIVAFDRDWFADNRLGIDVFESLVLPDSQKRHITIRSDTHGRPSFKAVHGAPLASAGQADAVDFLLWRYADVLEVCALTGTDCDTDLSAIGNWSDGKAVVRAVLSTHPVDVGPSPAILAECDAWYGKKLNVRIGRCRSSEG